MFFPSATRVQRERSVEDSTGAATLPPETSTIVLNNEDDRAAVILPPETSTNVLTVKDDRAVILPPDFNTDMLQAADADPSNSDVEMESLPDETNAIFGKVVFVF